jgi:hypothetical protein
LKAFGFEGQADSSERAILSRHNINLLGLRGQPKRVGAKMIELLDEYIPFVTGSEIDDPFNPISEICQRYYCCSGKQHLSPGFASF